MPRRFPWQAADIDGVLTCEQANHDAGKPRYHFDELGPAHRAVIACVPAGSKVLEVGSSTGYMTKALIQRGCSVVAIDIDPVAANAARQYTPRVMILDLNHDEVPPDVGLFDRIICADVLEHLHDPAEVLRGLTSRLESGGEIILSVPNVAFWRVRWQLLRGRFDYTEQGILDRTHLHFFTLQELRRFVSVAGCELLGWRGVSESFPGAWMFPGPLRWLKHRIDGVMFRIWPRVFSYQYVARLTPADRGR